MNTANIGGVKNQRLGEPKGVHVHVGLPTLKVFKQICFIHPSLEESGKLYGKIAKKNLTSNCLGLLNLINIWVDEKDQFLGSKLYWGPRSYAQEWAKWSGAEQRSF